MDYSTRDCFTILNESDEKIQQPEKITLELKPHQRTLVNACINLENKSNEYTEFENYDGSVKSEMKTRLGVICDLVGSGKTLSVLSLIATKNDINNTSEIFNTEYSNLADKLINFKFTSKLSDININYPIPINVIIVPHTIYKQWANTITNYTTLNYIGVYNKKTFEKFEEVLDSYYIDNDILLISSTKYKSVYKLLEQSGYINRYFNRFIIDEADSISIAAFKQLKAKFYWFITSTVGNLLYPGGKRVLKHIQTGEIIEYNGINYYNVSDYTLQWVGGLKGHGFLSDVFYSISHLHDCQLKQIFIKNDNNYIKNSYLLPKPKINNIICDIPYVIRIFDGLVPDNVIQSLNAGDIESAIANMNCSTGANEDNVISIITNSFTKDLENKKLEYTMKQQMHYQSESVKQKSLEKIKQSINRLEGIINNIKERINNDSNCPICMDTFSNKTVTKCCNNTFCFECIATCITNKTKCPMCRANLDKDSIIVINKNVKNKNTEVVLKDKKYNFKKLLEQIFSGSGSNKNKVIVFSNYDKTFNDLEQIALDIPNIKHNKIQGTAVSIENKIKNFKITDHTNKDNVNLLFLNSRYCGSGFNLENATHLIMFHVLSKELSLQVIGRAQRPGRTEPLEIYSFRYPNETIDDVYLETLI